MTIWKTILASAAVLAIIGSGALAQQNQTTGKIIRIDQANGKITLEHKQGGKTVGAAATRDLVDTYAIGEGLKLSAFKVGDP